MVSVRIRGHRGECTPVGWRRISGHWRDLGIVSELRVSEDAERLRAVLVFDPWLGSVMGQAGRRFQGMGVLESS